MKILNTKHQKLYNICKEVVKALVPYGILYLWRKRYIKNENRSKKLKKILNTKYKHPIMIRKRTSDVYVYDRIILQNEYEFEVEQEPNLIIDAGANIGLAAVYFANKFPNATIVAIEPEESNFEILIKNTEHYQNIKQINAALSDEIGMLDLLDVGFGKWGFMTSTKSGYQQIKRNDIKKINEVATITINKILEDYKSLNGIDILKIDIEGAEKEVFSNASEWICKVKSIIIELHEHMKVGCNRSFYCNTNGFDNEWQKGENVYLTKGNYIKKSTINNSM